MRISDWSSDVCSSDLSEFPLPVRAQREAGVRLLLVPSCTDTQAGATRVRVGCMARALENRKFNAQAVTTGAADWSPALRSEEHTSELQSLMRISYAVFCLKKNNNK